jgi:hypothetical protein
MGWQNFSIWRGRLPHWRADDVTYWVTFRHRRDLSNPECGVLYSELLRPEGRKWNLIVLCVLPSESNLIFTVECAPSGEPYELSDVVERAKTKAGKAIVKKSGERWPPFYQESYDRIIRDPDELESRLLEIINLTHSHEVAQDPNAWEYIWIAGRDD